MSTESELEATYDGSVEKEAWLLGQPSLSDYLDFVSDLVVDGKNADRAALREEWREANDYYQTLEKTEYGIADKVECRDLDERLLPLVKEIQGSSHYRRTFDTLPTRVGMVELDHLVIFQKSVTLDFIKAIAERIGSAPDPETLLHLCVPSRAPRAPVDVQRLGSKRFLFRSESTDFRFHEAVVLDPEKLQGYETYGAIGGVVGAVVGFGSNFLNVVEVGKRLLLHNGYHRACALRSLGITHAPCVIQTVTSKDELGIAAKREVVEDPEFYFQSARPPLLKDFFDRRIRKVLPIHKRERIIEISVEIRDFLVNK